MDPKANQTKVPMTEVFWRVGTSPWSFLFLSLALASWCLIGAFVPQASLTELGFRSGGSSVQTVRLFQANAITESWVTWVLSGLLFSNGLGLVLARKSRVLKCNLVAIVFAIMAMLSSLIADETGTIWTQEQLPSSTKAEETQEDAVHENSNFIAETRVGGGVKRVELPFRLLCAPSDANGTPCTIVGAKSTKSAVYIPAAGKGSLSVEGYRIALIGTRPSAPIWQNNKQVDNNSWIRLGNSANGPLLKPGEVLELSRSKQSTTAKIGSVRSAEGGSILIARSDKTMVGLDARMDRSMLNGANAAAPLNIKHIQSPRWLKLAYTRPAAGLIPTMLFHLGPFFVLLASLAAALGLYLKDEVKQA